MQFLKDNVAKILIHEDITEELASDLNYFINGLEYDEYNHITEIHVSINSAGGSVMAGYSIFSALKNSTKKVITVNEGISASIAGIVLLAGDEIYMTNYSLFMMHNPSGGDDKALLKIKESLINILSEYFDEEELPDLMSAETWLNADEMFKGGVINNIIYTNENIALDPVNNTIKDLHNICNSAIKKNDLLNMKNIFKKIKNELETTETTEVNEIKNTVEEVVNADTEKEEETESEEKKEEVSTEDLLDMIKSLSEKVNALTEEKEKAEAENKMLKNAKENEEKIEVLNKAGIESNDFDKWMNLDINTIKNLTSTIKVSKKAPVVETSKEITNSNDFAKLSKEEKLNLLNTNIDKYYKIWKKNK